VAFQCPVHEVSSSMVPHGSGPGAAQQSDNTDAATGP
jgi:hypothetical protein